MPFTIGPKIHNVIPSELKTLIEDFFSLTDWKGLYLTGGTCLAEYYFGHRLSVDVDLFTHEQVLFQEGKASLAAPAGLKHGTVSEIRVTPHIAQYTYRPNGSGLAIKIDLVFDVVPRISDPLQVGAVWVDSLEDILSNKVGCLVSREEVKDYLDLYYLIPSSHLSTKEIIALGKLKEGGLDPLILAHQIEFILKRDLPPQELLGKIPWLDLQLSFRKFQKECLDLIAPAG